MKAGGQVGKKIIRGCVVMKFGGELTVRERAWDHVECEGCGSCDKPVYTYLGQPGEPVVCSQLCFHKAISARFGGIRKPTRSQLDFYRARKAARLARSREKQKGTGIVLPMRRRKVG